MAAPAQQEPVGWFDNFLIIKYADKIAKVDRTREACVRLESPDATGNPPWYTTTWIEWKRDAFGIAPAALTAAIEVFSLRDGAGLMVTTVDARIMARHACSTLALSLRRGESQMEAYLRKLGREQMAAEHGLNEKDDPSFQTVHERIDAREAAAKVIKQPGPLMTTWNVLIEEIAKYMKEYCAEGLDAE